jgi:transposase InsO family protein
MAYQVIEAEKASDRTAGPGECGTGRGGAGRVLTVQRMCALLGVSRSGFYAWRQRRDRLPTPRAARREAVAAAVVQAHRESDRVYGAPRITAELRDQGLQVTRKTVAKVMAALGIQGVSPRPWRVTTQVDARAGGHPDLVGGVFDAGCVDRVWVSDITYLATGQGWLYLAAVRDGCSRRVLGYALADHLRAELVRDAVQNAVQLRGRLPERVVFHADRGTQYTSALVVDFAATHNLACSVGRTGVCWDNAMAESFWASLKVEHYYRHTWPTRAEAIAGVVAYIDWYNTRRRHSALGMRSPLQFELHHPTAATAA